MLLPEVALLYLEQNRFEDAEQLYIEALNLLRKIYEEKHPYVATTWSDLGILYAKKMLRERKTMFQRCFEFKEEIVLR